ncbi:MULTISPECIES: PfkB family carbohydrate kinase [unclassified Microbacterium]|uniref:PfkB family carbohydrate kinase n=1 Tax=unclassified Microbacterium TaxID=2609290 RepID=UPI0030179D91
MGARYTVVGDNTIDRYLDGPVLVGGNALNVAVQLRLLGAPVSYFGAVGDDEDGRLIAGALRARGVDADGLTTVPGVTAVTEIRLTALNDRVFEREEFGVTAAYRPTDAELDRIAEHAWVHIGMLPNAPEFVQRLRSRPGRRTISQDCAVSAGFAGLDVAFCSAGEQEDQAQDLARRALAGGASLAVVTRGAAGALATDGERTWRCAALPIDVVDTTGAGDAFIAGFAAARSVGAPVDTALDSGAQTAARACTHLGGFPQ